MGKLVWQISIITAIVWGVFMASCRDKALELPKLPTSEEYHAWRETTDIPLNYPIPGHGDVFREIYINPIGEAVEKKIINDRVVYAYPTGTVIVKEIYAGRDEPIPEEQPIKLTIMIKAPEHPLALNGWLWIDADVPPTQPHVITHRFCVDCHANANETHPYGDMNPQNEFRDFVFFPPRPH
ncbi:hypothetical protein U14_01780 [Candidatus Moduliflexus flocculans]|uniref:Cytochrome P460 domain-containing protein n=1 Tax=Candidatus Moduliflexus flocculans TaxID=1499966 RepID=A0A0S6VSW2_9BACT|nr:hypothetical protein U14_01780 [Candidatus Moduliflexus flocculans]